ncbi:MAG: hypothetical protein OXU42_13005 [Deltaproteobacteria bacterium]|nr:hypothetical protein [Deltaproteobacteria bacterium]
MQQNQESRWRKWFNRLGLIWMVLWATERVIGLAGLPEDAAAWSRALQGALNLLRLIPGWLSGWLLGMSLTWLVFFAWSNWGDRIIVKMRWNRIHLRDFWHEIVSVVWGVPVTVQFVNSSTKTRYKPERVHFRPYRRVIFVPPMGIVVKKEEIEMSFEVRGDSYLLDIEIMDDQGNLTRVSGARDYWSRHIGSHYKLNLKKLGFPEEIRVTAERFVR